MEYTVKIAKGLQTVPQAADIRKKVFVEEQGFVNEFDDIDADAYHVLITSDDNAVATGRLFSDETGWHIGRVAVLPEYRGLKLGEKVIISLEDYAKKQGVTAITLSSQVQASGFYEKLGYVNLQDLHMDEHCPHVTMKKTL
ncbi:MAG: GNAT family N-acetyltransferase [Ruminococcus sp.]|nr:GNAT family N-acetyltransferase [Ruminococcus sp.]